MEGGRGGRVGEWVGGVDGWLGRWAGIVKTFSVGSAMVVCALTWLWVLGLSGDVAYKASSLCCGRAVRAVVDVPLVLSLRMLCRVSAWERVPDTGGYFALLCVLLPACAGGLVRGGEASRAGSYPGDLQRQQRTHLRARGACHVYMFASVRARVRVFCGLLACVPMFYLSLVVAVDVDLDARFRSSLALPLVVTIV